MIGALALAFAVMIPGCFCIGSIKCLCQGYHPVRSFLAFLVTLPLTALALLLVMIR
jgi:hypothetical protein